MSRHAFTLPELLLALVLMAVVSTSIVRLTIHVIRATRSENERVQITATLRSAFAYLQREFRALDATDLSGGDIIQADATSLVYRSMQGLYTVCGSSPAGQTQLVLQKVSSVGLASLRGIGDSVMVFGARDVTTMRDAEWLRAEVEAYDQRGICDDGSPGVRVTLGGIPDGEFHRIQRGAPVRNFTHKWLRLYRDGQGLWWLGERRRVAVSGWSNTQPIVGPFAPDGVRFTYLGPSGNAAVAPSAVALIRVRLVGAPTRAPVLGRLGGAGPSGVLESEVALRNNAR